MDPEGRVGEGQGTGPTVYAPRVKYIWFLINWISNRCRKKSSKDLWKHVKLMRWRELLKIFFILKFVKRNVFFTQILRDDFDSSLDYRQSFIFLNGIWQSYCSRLRGPWSNKPILRTHDTTKNVWTLNIMYIFFGIIIAIKYIVKTPVGVILGW